MFTLTAIQAFAAGIPWGAVHRMRAARDFVLHLSCCGDLMSKEKEADSPDPSDISSNRSVAEEALNIARDRLSLIEQMAEAAKKAASMAADSQRSIAELLSDAEAKLSEISSVATQALAAKTQITDEQAVIATKSDHVQKAQEHADKVRADLDRVLTAATQQATETEGQKSRAQSAADETAKVLMDIRTAKGSIDSDTAEVGALLESAKEAAATIKNLAEVSATVESRVADYEKRLAELERQSNSQLQTITGLLPGATSVGLAHAFDVRRQTFQKPSVRWQWLFVGSVLAIVVLAATGLWHVYASGTELTYDELLRLWLARLPIVGALVWLALYASRESALAKRLEEDYGYKSAIASSFVGFHKQMSEIGVVAGSNEPLAKLCADTLATISSPPGRIYDKHALTVSPTGELKDAANFVVQSKGPKT